MVEYEACILGLEAALELKIKKIDVYGDSMLIICQVKGEWQTKGEIDGKPWYYDIKNFVQNQEYPAGASKMDKKTLED